MTTYTAILDDLRSLRALTYEVEVGLADCPALTPATVAKALAHLARATEEVVAVGEVIGAELDPAALPASADQAG